MNRRSFPSGQTSSALLKAMFAALGAEFGAAEAESWLKMAAIVRDEIDDETRNIPLSAQHQALVAFAQIATKEAIPRLWPRLIVHENLGYWMRVLRGTTTPAEAFARLEAAESEYGRTTRWEALESRPGYWRGRVHIAHDPTLEEDGLLRLARIAEVTAVPALFGFRGAHAVARESHSARGTSYSQEFEVSWKVPHVARDSAIGAAAGALAGLLPLLEHWSWGVFAAVSAGAIVVGGSAAGMMARDTARRIDSLAQATRVHALERSLILKESHERATAGQLEGTVAAGQYRIGSRMGSGSTGVIYQATRISDGLPVAIKLLRAAAAHEAVASDRLRREAEALGLSWHPNVVEVIDHGHLPDGTAYLVMELLQGESLAGRLKDRGPMVAEELWPMAMQICDALAAVHAAGVVHRDLKPSNIFLAHDEATGIERIKLLDFGIARVEWEETRITNTGGPLGTPGYMSPEQEVGSTQIDGRSDLFAFGAVLYECLVGEPPPPATPSGLVRTGEVPAVRLDSGIHKSASQIPPGWRAIIERAMAPVPADRFQDARAFAQALRGVQAGAVRVEALS